MDVKDTLSKILERVERLDVKMQEFCFESHPIAAALIFGSVMLGTSYELAQGFNEAYARREEYYRKMEEPIRCVPLTNPESGFAPR